jgi:hypothetical protein
MLDTIPPFLIGWVGPLVSIVPFTVLVRKSLRRPILFACFVYFISIVTGIAFAVTEVMDDRESATVAGVHAPVIYCLLLYFTGLFYRYFIRGQLRLISGNSVQGIERVERVFLALGAGLSGAFVGGLIGLTLGGIFSFIGVTFINIAYFLDGLLLSEANSLFLLENGIYIFGALGALAGGLVGAGQLEEKPAAIEEKPAAIEEA